MDDLRMTDCLAKNASVARPILSLAFGMAILLFAQPVCAQEAQWIWSPKTSLTEPGDSQGECYFRKQFTLARPEQAQLIFAAGDEFEIHINGQLCSRGQSYGETNEIEVGSMLEPGVNLIAAKVRHNSGQSVGLSLKLRVKEMGETRWRSLVTDETWKTRVDFVPLWKSNALNDIGWLKAAPSQSRSPAVANSPTAAPQTMQKAISANPEVTPVATSFRQPANQVVNHRFEIDPEFVVQQVLAPSETGSLIAIEFNEFGHLLLSKEGGPLLIADPSQPVGHPGRIRVFCKEVTSCQGILPLNGDVYVTAEGPQGLGLYQLSDLNRDGNLEVAKKLVGFKGKLGEHGPHGIKLGPDGMIYVVIGNGSQLDMEIAETSPYQHSYEGDLVPRYEDPGGHAQGIQAPGGTIARVALDGSKAEMVAGGIRNAYDLVFDDRGELFIHDSDMESDMGTTWYRPTYVFHVAQGAEFGWRSGWAKFPQHFIDQTPAICDTGRGSPTGAVYYQHLQFPVRYQNTIFLADWSEGRILALRKQPSGAGFVAQPEVFLKGRPLNVCDLAVGEDGGLYFCTGGRGTNGGVYRVTWNGSVPNRMLEFESDLARVIRHPQPDTAWARQSLAELKKNMGDQWASSLEGVCTETRNPARFRIRAMQLMVLFGPAPSPQLLEQLTSDQSAEIRSQAAWLCGLKGDPSSTAQLMKLLTDTNPHVRRMACEGCMRLGIQPDVVSLLPMLQSNDRVEAMSARRMLERIPASQWEDQLLASEDKRVFIQSAVALLTADPSLERSYKILARASEFMDGFVNDVDFVDLLRTMELALIRGEVKPERVPALASRIGNEFPSGSPLINQELSRLLAYLKVGYLDGRISEYLQSPEIAWEQKIHTAMYLQTIGSGLSEDLRLSIIDCLESAREVEGVGGSYALYLQRAVEEVAKTITADQVDTVFDNGIRWPNAVIAAFYKLPNKLDEAMVERLIELDQSVTGTEDAAVEQLRLGVIAVLARSGGVRAMEYLRQLWQAEPARRNDIVIGLSQQPDGENWAYLVSSLPELDDLTAREVLQKLTKVSRRPREPKYFRDVIELGYRLRTQGADEAIQLLEHWTGQQPALDNSNWQEQMNGWKVWFQTSWPDQPELTEEQSQPSNQRSVEQVLGYLEQNGMGDAERGQHLFTTAQCATCHQLRGIGQNVGPDLSTVALRFSQRELLEATLEPSKVIPDRYASKILLTIDGKQFHGMAVEQPDDSMVILQSDGKRVRVPADDIEEIKDSELSAMPAGLLDELSLSEISDLMAFMMQTKPVVANQAPAAVQPQVPVVR